MADLGEIYDVIFETNDVIIKSRYHIVESHKAEQINRTLGQCFDLAYHFWCGSAKYQHQQYQVKL